MAKGNLISGELPQNVVDSVVQKYTGIQTEIDPYKISITTDEKRRIPKAADEAMPFMEKGYDYTKTDPKYLPGYVSVPELDNDFSRTKKLDTVEREHKKTGAVIHDMGIVTKSDLFSAILQYYNNVRKAAELGDARAKIIADDLGKLFARSKGNASETPVNP